MLLAYGSDTGITVGGVVVEETTLHWLAKVQLVSSPLAKVVGAHIRREGGQETMQEAVGYLLTDGGHWYRCTTCGNRYGCWCADAHHVEGECSQCAWARIVLARKA